MSSKAPTSRRPWQGRRIVLGVTGGVAAYKVVPLARSLTQLGAEVDVILTRGAREFIRPLSFEAITGRRVHTELFPAEERGTARSDEERPDAVRAPGGGAALHIRLAREADLVCVAPATADFIARVAHGRADDLLTTTLLATTAPVLLCPAMNHRMYAHPQTQANLTHVASALGYRVVGPDEGPLAYGEEEGPGRLVEPDQIVEHVGRALGRGGPFEGRTVLVTAGPTLEPLDPVRFLSNRSSGRMGYAIATAAWRRGAHVVLVTGPTVLTDPVGVEVMHVETALEMREAVGKFLSSAEVVVFSAAVSDYRPSRPAEGKIKRAATGDSTTVELVMNPDIAAETRKLRGEGSVSVGFALETGQLLENAREKLVSKDFDLLVANDVTEEGAGFQIETNRVTIVSAEGDTEELPILSKNEVAERILDRVAERMAGGA